MSFATASFKKLISAGPEYICSVCQLLLFKKQVMTCRKESYAQKRVAVKKLAEKCISNKYCHKCSLTCLDCCILKNSPASKLWICLTCHRKI